MSKLRSINTHFWSDTYVIDLDPIEKLLFLYLLTNEQTNMLGIYEIHVRRIAFDTGIDKSMLLKIFDRFEQSQKAKYCDGYVILQNFLRHQSFNANMETSAVKSWNGLPLKIRKDDFCKPIAKALKGLTKTSEPIAEIEVEIETEVEVERECASDDCADYSFDDFWDDYDHKKDKKKSQQKWKRLSKADKLKIKEFIPVYLKHQPDAEYRKYPTTFINSEIWNDDWDAYPPKEQSNHNTNGKAKTNQHNNGITYSRDDIKDFEFDDVAG